MRLLTWNSFGAKFDDLNDKIGQYKVDVACVQECGVLPAKYMEHSSSEDVNGITLKMGVCTIKSENFTVVNFSVSAIQAKNERCSLAILAKPHVYEKWAVSLADRLRPLIGVKVNSVQGPLWVYTVHSPANNTSRTFADNVLDRIPMMHLRHFACLGDWNLSPDSFPPQTPAVNVVCNPRATHISGSRYDYIVTSGNLQASRVEGPVIMSDHFLQVFEV